MIAENETDFNRKITYSNHFPFNSFLAWQEKLQNRPFLIKIPYRQTKKRKKYLQQKFGDGIMTSKFEIGFRTPAIQIHLFTLVTLRYKWICKKNQSQLGKNMIGWSNNQPSNSMCLMNLSLAKAKPKHTFVWCVQNLSRDQV